MTFWRSPPPAIRSCRARRRGQSAVNQMKSRTGRHDSSSLTSRSIVEPMTHQCCTSLFKTNHRSSGTPRMMKRWATEHTRPFKYGRCSPQTCKMNTDFWSGKWTTSFSPPSSKTFLPGRPLTNTNNSPRNIAQFRVEGCPRSTHRAPRINKCAVFSEASLPQDNRHPS